MRTKTCKIKKTFPENFLKKPGKTVSRNNYRFKLISSLGLVRFFLLIIGCPDITGSNDTGCQNPADTPLIGCPDITGSNDTGCQNPADTPPPIIDTTDQVEGLLSKMTLAEKIGQMLLVRWSVLNNVNEDVTNYHLGALLGGGGEHPSGGNTHTAWADYTDNFQRIASNSRLGIPLLLGNDAVHGAANAKDVTVFPHHIGLGATGDADLVEQVARITALEASALGINWNYSPAVSVPRNIRWGRTYEGFSSDTELVSCLSAAEVWGLQSSGDIIATSKHFIADGGTDGGVDQGNANISEAELRSIHLPPFQAAIKAGVRVIMVSYSSWNGVKTHGDSNLVQGLLKDELGFSGLVISDWGAVDQLPGSQPEKIAAAVNAGIDMLMIPADYRGYTTDLNNLVAGGTVTTNRIDEAVRRILRIKFEFGLFESRLARRNLIPQIRSASHLAIAREAVSKSLVLLTNKNKALPLATDSEDPVLVVGAEADDIRVQCGGWTIDWQGIPSGQSTAGDTIIEALRAELGTDAVEHITTLSELQSRSSDSFASVIVVSGENPYAEWHGDGVPYLPNDSDFTRLVQTAAGQFDVPVIALILSGRPVILDSIVFQNADAVVALWLPGSEGRGISDVLVGRVDFSGRLPFAWPLNESGLTADTQVGILFPRGHGLSYDN